MSDKLKFIVFDTGVYPQAAAATTFQEAKEMAKEMDEPIDMVRIYDIERKKTIRLIPRRKRTYIVATKDYEGDTILGVYKRKATAEAAKDKYNEDKKAQAPWAEVDEHILVLE
jgi:uncharacterized membrane protein YqiK